MRQNSCEIKWSKTTGPQTCKHIGTYKDVFETLETNRVDSLIRFPYLMKNGKGSATKTITPAKIPNRDMYPSLAVHSGVPCVNPKATRLRAVATLTRTGLGETICVNYQSFEHRDKRTSTYPAIFGYASIVTTDETILTTPRPNASNVIPMTIAIQ